MDRPRERDFRLNNVTVGEVGDLGPGGQCVSQTHIPVNQWNDMKPGLIARNQAFYVFGRIDYIDAFYERRWTEYRFRLLVDAEGIPDERHLVMDWHAGNRSS
jgi:hypothetical protein